MWSLLYDSNLTVWQILFTRSSRAELELIKDAVPGCFGYSYEVHQ